MESGNPQSESRTPLLFRGPPGSPSGCGCSPTLPNPAAAPTAPAPAASPPASAPRRKVARSCCPRATSQFRSPGADSTPADPALPIAALRPNPPAAASTPTSCRNLHFATGRRGEPRRQKLNQVRDPLLEIQPRIAAAAHRVRHGADHELQPPIELLLRQIRQRLADLPEEAARHRPEILLDDPRQQPLGQDPAHKLHELRVAVGCLRRRAQKRVE